MTQETRRQFLKRGAAVGSALTLAPLGLSIADEAGRASESSQGPVDMAMARWAGETDPAPDALKPVAEKLTTQAIEALGGMKRFVSKGDVVWIKANIAWNRTAEMAANTNPDVVGALVRLCLDAGAKKVKVGDHTTHESRQTYANSGIEAAAEAAGAEMIHLDPNRFRTTVLDGKRIKEWLLYPEIVECDLVVNVPIVKHHSLAEATLCMKNYMGVIGGKRGNLHQDLPTCLCDLTAFMKPRLCVLDAVRVLTAHGPVGGRLSDVKVLNTVAAGVDIVALDAFGAELLGHKPEDIATVRVADAAGLGTMDYRALTHRELAVS